VPLPLAILLQKINGSDLTPPNLH